MTILRFRRVTVTVLAVACAGTLAACGSSSHTSTSAGTGPTGSGSGAGAGRVAFKLTATQQACLKKHGVASALGGGRFAAGGHGSGPAGGTAPTGVKGTAARKFKRGAFPHSGRNSAAFAKRQAAMKACGITFPSGGQGGPGGGGAPPAG